MPNFFYIAKSLEGKTETGVVCASDERQLVGLLKDKGLLLIKVNSQYEGRKIKIRFSVLSGRVSLLEKIMIVRNMEVMFSAGLSLVKTFDVLSGQTRNARLKNILSDIRGRINKGGKLSDALSIHHSVFSDFFISMVRAGEESGTLDNVLRTLATHLSKEHELRSKIRNAMMYPALILIAMFVVGGVMIIFVFPSIKVFFSTLNVDIPIYTKIMLGAGDFLSKHWYLLFIAPFIFIVSVILVIRTKSGKKIIHGLLLKLPIISSIIKKNNTAFFVRSMSSLIGTGVSLVRSLEISSEIVRNCYFQTVAMEASQKVKKGESLSSALMSERRLFPYGVIEMIQVGEETGQTSDILKKLADFYEQEAFIAIERIAIMIEPALIIVLGLGVGFFALSVIQPIYSSLQAIT